eukprot:PhM_4_TR15244/c0_g1_i1/m.59387
MLHHSRLLFAGSVRTAQEAYGVLGVPATCTIDDIKTKYRELVKKHHPDSPGGSAKRMEEVNEAYSVLVKEGGHLAAQRAIAEFRNKMRRHEQTRTYQRQGHASEGNSSFSNPTSHYQTNNSFDEAMKRQQRYHGYGQSEEEVNLDVSELDLNSERRVEGGFAYFNVRRMKWVIFPVAIPRPKGNVWEKKNTTTTAAADGSSSANESDKQQEENKDSNNDGSTPAGQRPQYYKTVHDFQHGGSLYEAIRRRQKEGNLNMDGSPRKPTAQEIRNESTRWTMEEMVENANLGNVKLLKLLSYLIYAFTMYISYRYFFALNQHNGEKMSYYEERRRARLEQEARELAIMYDREITMSQVVAAAVVAAAIANRDAEERERVQKEIDEMHQETVQKALQDATKPPPAHFYVTWNRY